MKGVLPDGAQTSGDGHLVIGGCDATELSQRYGTPLIVFDRSTFEARGRAISAEISPGRVFYAGKAFLCVAVCQLVEQLGLGLDVCSGGELATAIAASFPSERIVFHGNNKSVPELEAARVAGVGRVVVDSFEEFDRLAEVGMATKLLVRITPGVEAHTHEFIQTGQDDSKFGFTPTGGVALEAVRRAINAGGCEFTGLHAHIGSQIFDLAGFDLAIRKVVELMAEIKESLGVEIEELNMGGGFGIAYVRDEDPLDLATVARGIVAGVTSECEAHDLVVPAVFLEPGRALSGPAGVTLYEVGTVKNIAGVNAYVSVDGGMSDNPRYPLYGAKYEAFLANRMNDDRTLRATVAGKHCESGDILIAEVALPADVRPGDLLCIPATGAYTYSMASNYNRVPRPAVVMVEDGNVTEIIRRETNGDLLRSDRRLDGSPL